VEAKYKGGSKWYKGEITRVNVDGSYNINYDDGDQERRVPARNVRKLGGGGGGRTSPQRGGGSLGDSESDSGAAPKLGDRVEAKYKGGSKWYKGEITRVNVDGSYNINYDDGDQERRVPAQNVRLAGGGMSNSPRRGVSRGASESDGAGDFELGSRVEAKYKGGSKWFKGEISRVNPDGSYAINYDDGDRERSVPARNVRRCGESGGTGGGRSSLSPRRPGNSASESSIGAGDRVEARYGGKMKWYKGRVTRANRDGTFDIDYDDGDRERGVAASLVRRDGGGASSGPVRPRTTYALDDSSPRNSRLTGATARVRRNYAADV